MRKALVVLGMLLSLQTVHAIPNAKFSNEQVVSNWSIEELSVEAKCCPEKHKEKKSDCRREKSPCNNEQRECCARCPTGPVGPTGPTGPVGPTGPQVVQAYITLSLDAVSQTVPNGDVVIFNTVGPSLNIINANPTLVLPEPGTYSISYGVATENNDNLHYVVLLLNGNTIPGSLLPVNGQTGAAQFSSNTIIATVPSTSSTPSTLQLQSFCPVNDPLVVNGGNGVSASLTVLRISD